MKRPSIPPSTDDRSILARVRRAIAAVVRALSFDEGDAELYTAQFTALSRLIPQMYFILVANAWTLAITFVDLAPRAIAIYPAVGFTIICAVRVAKWWVRKGISIDGETARRELRRTSILSGILGMLFPTWSFLLFPYGDPIAQAHVAFFLMVSMLSCMYSLIHTRQAALVVAAVVGVPYIAYFATRGIAVLQWIALNVALVLAASIVIVVVQNRDFIRMVNARNEARRREREQNRLLQMIDDMPVAVMTADPETYRVNYLNETSRRTLKQIEHLLPVKADQLMGSPIDLFHSKRLKTQPALSEPSELPPHTRVGLGGEVLDLRVSKIHADDGSYLGPMLAWSIVTKEAQAEHRIRQLAHYDSLTGLPNRNTFHEQLGKALARTDNRLSLLFIDLDGFKIVNDTRGHRIGDELLGQVARRIRIACEGVATATARLGGDEFSVVLPHHDPELAQDFSRKLITALSAPFQIEQHQHVRIGASVGIALAPEHGHQMDVLLMRADIALYEAKAAGKGTVRLFDPIMEDAMQERVQLDNDLRATLESPRQGRLFVFYQPIVDVRTGKVTAREALLRWHHPKRGWISPAEFIAVAEASGLIDELGWFVLSRACRDAVQWEEPIRVAVNISATQLGKGTLVPSILNALKGSRLPPGQLEIEITETALLGREGEAIDELRYLREAGVRVALDDFGTGYSSLAHLRAFPFDKIKIDGSFVRDAVERPDCAAVVRAVAELGKRLGVSTVAEGVETKAQLACILAEGCSEVQGYLFGRPEPISRDVSAVAALNRQIDERAARERSAQEQAKGAEPSPLITAVAAASTPAPDSLALAEESRAVAG